MINAIWFFLISLGVLVGLATGRGEGLTRAIISSAESAVTLVISLAGILTLWSGVMKVAEEAGLVTALSRLVRPLVRILFPDVPGDHPAAGAIAMSFLANVLGMGNAATPLGLRAMEELEKLNPNKDEPSDAMCTFLALAVSGFTLIPTAVIAIRAQAGSENPADTVVPSIFISLLATLGALLADRTFRNMSHSPFTGGSPWGPGLRTGRRRR